jgi:hypothetical protein
MGEERLSGLALINIHNGEVNFDIDKICELFISKHPRRMFHATLFTWSEWLLTSAMGK